MKESDVTTFDDPIISDPIDGEIYRVIGTVADTNGMVISESHVKAYFDDLEIETIADNNGNFTFEIPITKSEGYFVASKENYSKSISRYSNDAPEKGRRLFLTENANSNAPDLKLVTDSLMIARGRAVEPDGSPIENANIVATAIFDSTFIFFDFLGFTQTAPDGSFEIIAERKNYLTNVVVAKFPAICGTQFGKAWDPNDSPADLGDFEITTGIGDDKTFSTRIIGEGCTPNEPVEVKSYLTNELDLGIYEQTDPNVEITYCSSTDSEQIFVGAQSPDKKQFDGRFVALDNIESDYDFSICTPDGFFGEITTISGTRTATGSYNPLGSALFLNTQNENFVISLFIDAGLNVGGERKLQSAYIPGLFTYNSTTGERRSFDSDSDFGIYADIVENNDDMISGVISGSGFDGQGNEENFHIRFRVEKR